jgi:hypothetical protein
MQDIRQENKMVSVFQKSAAVLLLLCPATLFAADGTFDKTLHVNGPATLSISTGSGSIRVTAGQDSRIHIIGHVHAGKWGSWMDSSSPEQRVQQIVSNPPIEQNGNTVSIGKHLNEHNVSIDYDITAPKGTDLSASSGSGDIHITNLSGPAKISTGSGSIDASGLSRQVLLETGSGEIRAEMLASDNVKAQTGSGSIRLKNVQGALFAETGSGNLEIQGQPTAPWKLETGSGSITMITGDAHFSLDASSGSGSIHSSQPLTIHGNLNSHHVMGDIHGGGPTVRAETGSGEIQIR